MSQKLYLIDQSRAATDLLKDALQVDQEEANGINLNKSLWRNLWNRKEKIGIKLVKLWIDHHRR